MLNDSWLFLGIQHLIFKASIEHPQLKLFSSDCLGSSLGDLSLICSSTLVALEGNFGEEGQTCGGGGPRNEKMKGPKWLEVGE